MSAMKMPKPSEVTKARYRLPAEAKWEYACRARDRDAYTFGNTISDQQANFGWNVDQATEVGAYPANGWNLHDMHGNVWEWCADAPRTYKPEPVTDPKGSGTRHVLRGGSWLNDAQDLRSAGRYADEPDVRSNSIGFRCARVQGPAGQE
jgi:formylglycine-generating enzyme required for sulfatase activity